MTLVRVALVLRGLAATRALARTLAGRLAPGDVVALEGDLGAGKSELARALVRALAGADIPVPSPTFTLLQVYETPALTLTHADLYRLSGVEEAMALGLEEAWETGALVVEWPDRAEGLLPADRLTVRLAIEAQAPPDHRLVELETKGRLSDLVRSLAPP